MRAGRRPALCTIVTASHLARGHVLVGSFLEHHPDGTAFVLHVDGVGAEGWHDARIAPLALDTLAVPGLADLRARYTPFELCNALKPFLLGHLLRTTPVPTLCYVDADVCFFDALGDEVWSPLDEGAILLTPHLCHIPEGDDAVLTWRDLAILQRGVYNAGFLGLRRGDAADRFLWWWGSRVREAGYRRLAEGMNCDQRWLDFAPGFEASVRVSRHPGLNAAYWNLHERRFERREGRLVVNGVPLRFFHFSGYDPGRPDRLTSAWTPFTFDDRPDVRPAFDAYRRRLERAQAALGGPARAPDAAAGPLSAPPPEPEPAGPPPRVSVVIAAFEAARYVAEAVESALAQRDVAHEVIVIDDGSTDGTGAALAAHRDRIRYRRQDHAGVSTARNHGVAMARGELIAFLDADDRFLRETTLAERVARFDEDPRLDLVQTGWRIMAADGALGPVHEPWRDAPTLDLRTWLLRQPILPSAMMIRRRALGRVGGFDPALAHLEDVDLVLRLALAGARAAWVEHVGVAYRRHAAAATGRVDEQAAALERVTTDFFARPELPVEIRGLEGTFRYNTGVWMAYRFHAAGRPDEMAAALLRALPYAPSRSETAPLAWMARFEALAALDGGRLQAYALTASPQWRRVMRTLGLVGAPESGDPPLAPPGPSRRACAGSPAPAGTRAGPPPPGPTVAAVPPARLDLRHALQRGYGRHRSGWIYALRSLAPLSRDGGVQVDGFVDHTFDATAPTARRPWREPWLGFVHNPPGMPPWFMPGQSPRRVFANPAFRESLAACLGLFCLSEYHRAWLAERVSVPVTALSLPTGPPGETFTMARFLASPVRRLVQVGSWLRRLHSIHYVPVTQLRRTIVHQHVPYIDALFAAERREYGLAPDGAAVETLPFLDATAYDELLASCVVYLDLYDASANNVVVECLARATPLLVNPLPAIREYLGADYPLYFASRADAARKAEDTGRLEAAHRYLAASPRRRLVTGDAFLAAVAGSAIYRALPAQ